MNARPAARATAADPASLPRHSVTGAVPAGFPDDTARWRAVTARDPRADGSFFYSVRTTGVYCWPSCSSRRPRAANVGFHDSREAAEAAGFRPCRRCRPDLPSRDARALELVARACRAIESAATLPALGALARDAGLSPWHFHRTFKRMTGVTPRAYAAAHRARRAQDELMAGPSVTDSIYAAGFSSAGRFYAAADGMLGMTPAAYRRGGAGESLWHAIAPCSLGLVLVAAGTRGICAILLGDDPESLRKELRERFPSARFTAPAAEAAALVANAVAAVDRPARAALDALPLDIRGTAFQRQVWEALRALPPGGTTTYSELARRIGRPRSVRAVAGACAANPIAVLVPCHRVLGADGALTGYRWGIERKRLLIERERAEADAPAAAARVRRQPRQEPGRRRGGRG